MLRRARPSHRLSEGFNFSGRFREGLSSSFLEPNTMKAGHTYIYVAFIATNILLEVSRMVHMHLHSAKPSRILFMRCDSLVTRSSARVIYPTAFRVDFDRGINDERHGHRQ